MRPLPAHNRRGTALAPLVLAVLTVMLPLGCGGMPWRHQIAAAPDLATVVRVVDGDTVVLRLRVGEEHVRLIGVDTPETVKPNTPVQCFGPQASSHLKHLLPPGTTVRVARDAEARDHFGRLLLYLWRVSDGRFVNLEIAADGFGRPLSIAPNIAHRADIATAVSKAQAEGTGLWAACPP